MSKRIQYQIGDPDSACGSLQKYNGDFLDQGRICDNTFIMIRSVFFQRSKTHCERNAVSCGVGVSFKKFLDLDPDAWLPKL